MKEKWTGKYFSSTSQWNYRETLSFLLLTTTWYTQPWSRRASKKKPNRFSVFLSQLHDNVLWLFGIVCNLHLRHNHISWFIVDLFASISWFFRFYIPPNRLLCFSFLFRVFLVAFRGPRQMKNKRMLVNAALWTHKAHKTRVESKEAKNNKNMTNCSFVFMELWNEKVQKRSTVAEPCSDRFQVERMLLMLCSFHFLKLNLF